MVSAVSAAFTGASIVRVTAIAFTVRAVRSTKKILKCLKIVFWASNSKFHHVKKKKSQEAQETRRKHTRSLLQDISYNWSIC